MIQEVYEKVYGIKKPYKYQRDVFEKIQNYKNPVLLKAPTGSGKTEAAIAPFLLQFLEDKFLIAPRLIYVLPMRIMVNNIADRIRKYAKKISPFISVEVQHGDVPNTPFFISDIVVTTLDQFLYAFARTAILVGKHIDIPAGSIASSIVIFDEAHMYRDEFTFSIMRALMEILGKSHVPFVVMTATMPEALEKSLFENRELFSDIEKIIAEVDIQSELEVTIEDMPLFSNEKMNISDELLNKVKNKKTLIVVNQVGRAQKVYEEVKEFLDLDDDEIVLLHSRFTKVDRKSHEQRAVSLVPHKDGGKIVFPEGIGVVVSTQVLEAGLDFSAELLITELAPADALIQRAGRCARYEGEKGEMIIFNVEREKGHLPYDKSHIESTFNWMKENPDFNLKHFSETCKFADILNYRANDFEASETLVDLYECVLYADTVPKNIQLRQSKPITLVVVDPSIGRGRKKEDRLKDALTKIAMGDNSISVDFSVGWSMLKQNILTTRLDFNNEKDLWEPKEVRGDILPFKYYLLDKTYYDHAKGVISNVTTFVV
ncbi:MAG: CRISPR-associated helicase Cas3' [Deltaproteobacteria bacterium]|nr:CRISPR-associated helicase Cas3' [Deltaproteobacteria bacterium]MBW1978996.1 CRISPR-associated helicase Cas3' [Deltaproteobacteria bacterium]MBW2045925.1 CRISPR-associated helicase Cas3' [Deltaproteobacteria bacterium]MBW2300412.1 CRISPR-associated helicase Cas3' [Deltaproteobacteria bacterium]